MVVIVFLCRQDGRSREEEEEEDGEGRGGGRREEEQDIRHAHQGPGGGMVSDSILNCDLFQRAVT